MSKQFLIGNFLSAYGKSFGRLPHGAPDPGALSYERLETRFNDRADAYHARELERRNSLQVGMVMSFVLLIGAFSVNITLDGGDEIVQSEQELVQIEEIQQTAQVETPPPPPRPPVPVAVPDDEVLENEALDLDMSLDIDAVVDLPPPPPTPVMEEEESEPEIFVVVEQRPEIIGGLERLYAVTPYPDLARKSELEGTVVVKIVVTPDGKPSQPEVLRGVHPILDKAAINGVMQLEFRPGEQRGRAVSTYFSIPVRFKLN